ncbi:MAG TPA: DUF2905 domain-containing protein [Candidatus Limnocylindrales bacterium]|nr:DUF2905 domain-containing protein [Candidatus Limnocylindrales bacterium]
MDSIPNLETFGKLLLVAGGLIAAAGLLLVIFNRFGLGRLPGDIIIQRERFVFYFPIVTAIIISVILTMLANLFRR